MRDTHHLAHGRDGFRFALPILRLCELICLAQAQSCPAACDQLARRQITSDFPKSCQARDWKIFRFRSYPNQRHNSACLTAD